jgi:hypothetical protein
MDAFREAAYRRWGRQAWTLARAVRAGRAHARADPARAVAPVDGETLRDLAATVAGIRGAPGIFPMRWPGPRSHARAMNTTTVNPGAHATGNSEPCSRTESRYHAEPERTALRRPSHDRMLTGVAEYLESRQSRSR